MALFQMIWKQGGWTLYIDETYYVEHELGLHRPLIKLLTQGRSKWITVVLGVQRPAWVSRFVMSEPTHVFNSRLHDQRDIKMISLMDGDEYADKVMQLKRFEFEYLDRDSRHMQVVNRDSVSEVLK